MFANVELVRQSRKVSKADAGGRARTYDLQDYNPPLYHCATLSTHITITLGVPKEDEKKEDEKEDEKKEDEKKDEKKED